MEMNQEPEDSRELGELDLWRTYHPLSFGPKRTTDVSYSFETGKSTPSKDVSYSFETGKSTPIKERPQVDPISKSVPKSWPQKNENPLDSHPLGLRNHPMNREIDALEADVRWLRENGDKLKPSRTLTLTDPGWKYMDLPNLDYSQNPTDSQAT